MKKFLPLLVCLISALPCFSQITLSAPSSAVSGAAFTITAAGESSSAWVAGMFYYPNPPTVTNPANQNVTIATFSIAGYAYPQAATKFSTNITTTSSSPVTVTFNVRMDVFHGGGGSVTNQDQTITITINPAVTTFYNVAKSAVFTKNNCGAGTVGTAVTYTIPANTYTASTQAAADALATNALNSGGQAYANANGNCLTVYYNSAISASFSKNDCPANYTPAAGSYSYSISASAYSSTVSQADADSKALNALNTQGQSNANNLGTCNENRIGIRTMFRTDPYDATNQTLSRVWLKEPVDLTGISLDSYSASGIYAYASQYGTTKVAAGWYTELYTGPTDGNFIRVFQVNVNGEIVSYTMVQNP
ncbi:DUF5977 domain-containing protein [Pedobacter metabolipauper]|uniref:DUF5977 domain-containing protein n=1 Tax=Pedobacter metabolipauper TaxID=425513 RepID=A0A4R6SWI1_9SPHI|nr:DUF5977 domain-containing protein [Pedobacter metabolipauper]TDQ09483.1 hypothetical protein ATK78_1638 [Pedobacter metabolipauper]